MVVVPPLVPVIVVVIVVVKVLADKWIVRVQSA